MKAELYPHDHSTVSVATLTSVPSSVADVTNAFSTILVLVSAGRPIRLNHMNSLDTSKYCVFVFVFVLKVMPVFFNNHHGTSWCFTHWDIGLGKVSVNNASHATCIAFMLGHINHWYVLLSGQSFVQLLAKLFWSPDSALLSLNADISRHQLTVQLSRYLTSCSWQQWRVTENGLIAWAYCCTAMVKKNVFMMLWIWAW